MKHSPYVLHTSLSVSVKTCFSSYCNLALDFTSATVYYVNPFPVKKELSLSVSLYAKTHILASEKYL